MRIQSKVSNLFSLRGRCWSRFQTAAAAAATVAVLSTSAVCVTKAWKTHKRTHGRQDADTKIVLFPVSCYWIFMLKYLTKKCILKCKNISITLQIPVCVEKAEVCLFQGVTVLEPGQALVQYLEGELCYTVHCLHHRDPESGFYAMDVSSVNCSQKCGPVWSFFDAFEHFIYHQYGPAVLRAEPLFMCSTRCTSRPLTLRCAVAPAKISPARLLMKTGLRIFSLYELHIHLLFAPLIIYLFSQRDWFCFFV